MRKTATKDPAAPTAVAPPAIKFQWHKEKREGYDQRGGEPNDTHRTIKLPGMDHGLELDPAPQDAIDRITTYGDAFNEELNQQLTRLGFDNEKFGYFGFYLMDGNGDV